MDMENSLLTEIKLFSKEILTNLKSKVQDNSKSIMEIKTLPIKEIGKMICFMARVF